MLSKVLLLIGLTAGALVASDSVVVYEVDGVSQTGRIISFGRPTKQGEIPTGSCLRPVVGGVAIADGSWQDDVKNAWPDGSRKLGQVSFIAPTFGANSSLTVTFQAGTCNNTGLTQTQAYNYDTGGGAGSWGAQMLVTDPTGTATQTTDAKVMINPSGGLTAGDCKLTAWLSGPVLTQYIVQDCTATSAYDFGAHWDGVTMNLNAGAWFTTTNQYASLHPMFLLSFYGASGKPVGVDFILENMWTGRIQDQKYSVVLKTGATPAQIYTSTGQPYADASGRFVQFGSTRWQKHFWSGTAPGHIRIDHNFAYLVSTKLLPSFDLTTGAVSPDSASSLNSRGWPNSVYTSTCPTVGSGLGDYDCYVAGDRGDLLGHSLQVPGMNGGNDKGRPIGREDLEYLYNMSTCGTANGACAKAWALLTGEVDANASTTLTGVPGGGGLWAVSGHWPIHQRESGAGLPGVYCPGYDVNNTTQSSSCGVGVGNTVGHGISRHARPTTGQMAYGYIVSPVGTFAGPSSWGLESNCAHYQDTSYVAYLLTGSYFDLEEVQQGANYCDFATNPDAAWYDANGLFVTFNFITGTRYMSWALLQQSFAATVTPDGFNSGAETSYYNAVIKNNARMMEGYYGITGTSLTPTSPNTACTAYAPRITTPGTATMWDFGHCGHGVGVFPTLHNPAQGACWNQDVYSAQTQVTASGSTSPALLTTTLPASVQAWGDNAGNTVNIWGATGAWTALNSSGPTPGSSSYGIIATGFTSSSTDSLTVGTGSKTLTTGAGQHYANGLTVTIFSNSTGNSMTGPVTSYSGTTLVVNVTSVNGSGTFTDWTIYDLQHLSVPVNSTTFGQPLTGTVQLTDGLVDQTASTDFQEPWMDSGYGIIVNLAVDMGFTAWSSLRTEINDRMIEILQDAQFNPWLSGLYEYPTKNGGASCAPSDGTTTNPFLASWAAVKSAIVVPWQNMNTFDASQVCSTDHSYPLLARALASFLPGLTDTCSQGACTGTAAWTWANQYVPLYTRTVTGSLSCSAGDDIQVQFVLTPRTISSGMSLSGSLSISGKAVIQ